MLIDETYSLFEANAKKMDKKKSDDIKVWESCDGKFYKVNHHSCQEKEKKTGALVECKESKKKRWKSKENEKMIRE